MTHKQVALKAVLALACSMLVAGISRAPYGCYQEDVALDVVGLTCAGVDLGTLGDFLLELDALVASGTVQVRLELQESAIAELPPDFLKPYPIQSLILFNDSLVEFPRDLLANVDSDLVALDLSLNFIGRLRDGELDALPFADALQVLNLAQNELAALRDDNPFGAFPNLQKLFLQLNRIDSVPDNAFADLGALTELHLYGNDIGAITPNAFGNLPVLQKLSLNENQIRFLENGTFSDENFPMLENIYLGNNPFYCNCTLDWFKTWLQDRNLLFGSDATCDYPFTQPFSLQIFCPSGDQIRDRIWAEVQYRQYVRYVENIILQDPREREYRLTHKWQH